MKTLHRAGKPQWKFARGENFPLLCVVFPFDWQRELGGREIKREKSHVKSYPTKFELLVMLIQWKSTSIAWKVSQLSLSSHCWAFEVFLVFSFSDQSLTWNIHIFFRSPLCRMSQGFSSWTLLTQHWSWLTRTRPSWIGLCEGRLWRPLLTFQGFHSQNCKQTGFFCCKLYNIVLQIGSGRAAQCTEWKSFLMNQHNNNYGWAEELKFHSCYSVVVCTDLPIKS